MGLVKLGAATLRVPALMSKVIHVMMKILSRIQYLNYYGIDVRCMRENQNHRNSFTRHAVSTEAEFSFFFSFSSCFPLHQLKFTKVG